MGILDMRNKIQPDAVYAPFITPADAETFSSDLMKAEDWLYDNFEGTKVQFVEKMHELEKFGGPVVQRYAEAEKRDDWVAAIEQTLKTYRSALSDERYSHIAEEEKAKIVAEHDTTLAWLNDMKA